MIYINEDNNTADGKLDKQRRMNELNIQPT